MEVSLFKQMTAPTLTAGPWWIALSSVQKRLLVVFILLYAVGLVFILIALGIDHCFTVRVTVSRIALVGFSPMNIQPSGISIAHGVWRVKVANITPPGVDTAPPPARRTRDPKKGKEVRYVDRILQLGHRMAALDLWQRCYDLSVRGRSLLHVGQTFALIALAYALYILPTLVMFRSFVLVSPALFISAMTLAWICLFAGAKEFAHCDADLKSLFGSKLDGKNLFIRSRLMHIDVTPVAKTMTCIYLALLLFFLPAMLVGFYAVVFRSRRL